MRRFTIELDDSDAECLETKIDDDKPSLEKVAVYVLTDFSQAVQQYHGYRPCICGSLEKISSETNSPIAFDILVNEYEILRETQHGNAKHVIRYCFWCGGRAPATKRDQLFAKVDFIEVERLNSLCADIKTFDDAINRFGPPQSDRPVVLSIIKPTSEGGEETTAHRVISYEGLSETANVNYTQRAGGPVSVSFTGKYIGPPV